MSSTPDDPQAVEITNAMNEFTEKALALSEGSHWATLLVLSGLAQVIRTVLDERHQSTFMREELAEIIRAR